MIRIVLLLLLASCSQLPDDCDHVVKKQECKFQKAYKRATIKRNL